MDCTLYGKECCSKRQMLKHIKEEHPSAKWPCEFCGKQYDSYNRKYKHERSAHSKKKYLCSTCGCGFDYQSQLDMHTPTHEPSAKVYCENCGKRLCNMAFYDKACTGSPWINFLLWPVSKAVQHERETDQALPRQSWMGYRLVTLWWFPLSIAWKMYTPSRKMWWLHRSQKKETGPCFSRTKTFCLTSKFV